MASLSVDDCGGGRFKIRWRELVAGPAGLPRKGKDGRLVRRSRSITVEGKDARDEAVAQVRRALVAEGEYQPPAATLPPPVANLETASLAWVAWKRTRCKPGSVVAYAGHMARFFAAARQIEGIRKDRVVPATSLSRHLVVECIRLWQQEDMSEAWGYSAARSVIDMWRWVSDDPARYPGVTAPPREAKTILPRVPIYVAPPAPTLAEADACLRHVTPDAEEARRLGVVLRFTGLRVSQVLALRRGDIDLEHRTLVVTVGKSRMEEAERRTIPLSAPFVAEISPWAAGRRAGDLLFPRFGVAGDPRRASAKADSLKAAWVAATAAGEAREIVWKPVTRKISRPEHAFRAAFQAHLRKKSVAEEVIDALVGHHGRSVRARHYAGSDSLWERMQEAMDHLPPVDWTGPKEKAGKVVELRGRAREVVG